eukprot:GHVR01180126.1.p1 GENE.GHVR01180126.1~~GHVR01180126.1.p1  ORF type:complete len:211 (-),score=13.41 GHVR01180126.1:97-729(-)
MILSLQLLVTFGICSIFLFSSHVRMWVVQNTWFIILSFVLAFGTLCAMSCICTKLARTYPWNYIMLSVFTVAEGMLLGTIVGFTDFYAVGIAALVTFLIVVALTAFACQTKYDFTGMGPYLFILLVSLIIFGFVAGIFFSSFGILQIVYAYIGALLFSMYLVYDTQLIVGGKNRKHQFSVDEYVFAALNLYLDIVNLFLFILTIVSHTSD